MLTIWQEINFCPNSPVISLQLNCYQNRYIILSEKQTVVNPEETLLWLNV